jgi:predicted membrane-bound dolichyl-phosphate-mannose-protein mannosyltransferase
VTVQVGRPLQIESLGAAILEVAHAVFGLPLVVESTYGLQNLAGSLPQSIKVLEGVIQVGTVIALWVWFARRRPSIELLILASSAAVCLLIAFDSTISPQYMIWLVPLVPLVAGRRGLAATIGLAAACIFTQLWFPGRYFDLVRNLDPGVAWLVLARDLTLVGIAFALLLPWLWLAEPAGHLMVVLRREGDRVRRIEPVTALGLVLLSALALRAIWLWLPSGSLIFDESYYVNASRVILGWTVPSGAPYAGSPIGLDPNTEHPPLAKLLMAGSMLVFGDNGLGWRIPSVVAGVAALSAVYWIVRGAGESQWLGVLAVSIYSLDILSFVHGRIGTLDMMALAFILLGAALALRRHWMLAGVAFALGALCKETAVFGLFAFLILEGLSLLDARRRGEGLRLEALRPAAICMGAFLVVGLSGLWVLDWRFTSFASPLDHLAKLFGYGIALQGGPSPSGIASNPWDWLVNGGQFDYLRVAVNSLSNGQVVASRATVEFRALLNPVLIGSAALIVPFAVVAARNVKSQLARWSIVWMAANYLPFVGLALVSHRISYLYYILPTIPGLAVAAAILLARSGLPRLVTLSYLGASAVAFAAYFPFREFP